MTIAIAKPWLGLYGGLPASTEPANSNALEMFTDTLHRAPQAPVIHYFDTTITAADVDAASSALAVGLIAAGVEPGDRVAMYLQNVPQAMITLLAAWKCGAVVVPCNPMLRDRELSKILVDSGTRVLICLDDLYEQVAVKALPATAVETTITTSARDFLSATDDPALLRGVEAGPCTGSVGLLDLLARYRDQVPPALELTGDDVALMVYTSGTTGAPKAATNTHSNVVFATTVYQRWLDLGDRDAILGLAPLFHVTGLIGHLATGHARRVSSGALLPIRCRRGVPTGRTPPRDIHRVRRDGVHRVAQQRRGRQPRSVHSHQGLHRRGTNARRSPGGLVQAHRHPHPPDVRVDGSDLPHPHDPDGQRPAGRPCDRGGVGRRPGIQHRCARHHRGRHRRRPPRNR